MPEAVAHDAVDLGDHLHVGVFDAVVDGLDEVPRTVRPDQGAQGSPLNLAEMAVKMSAHAVPGVLRAAGHDRRAVPGAFLAAGDADAEEIDLPSPHRS